MRKRLFTQNLERGIIGNLAAFEHAAMAMIRILAQANIGDHQQVELCFPDSFDGTLHHAVRVQRTLAARVFAFRQPE
jgi:hypothetical protein